MPDTITIGVTMELITCCNCALSFAVPQPFVTELRRSHADFRCPNGHVLAFRGESDVEKLTRQKRESENRIQAELNEANHARLVIERELDKLKRAKRKLEVRISRGVCPCCDRTFENLQRHMATKHKNQLGAGVEAKKIEASHA